MYEILGWAGVFCAGGLTAYCLMLLGRGRPPKRPKGPAAIVSSEVWARQGRQAIQVLPHMPVKKLEDPGSRHLRVIVGQKFGEGDEQDWRA